MTGTDRADLAPSAKYVLSLIEEKHESRAEAAETDAEEAEVGMGRAEILDAADPIYQKRTVEDALKDLREAGFVKRTTCPRDNREVIYKLDE